MPGRALEALREAERCFLQDEKNMVLSVYTDAGFSLPVSDRNAGITVARRARSRAR
jgi:hypothetical protein